MSCRLCHHRGQCGSCLWRRGGFADCCENKQVRLQGLTVRRRRIRISNFRYWGLRFWLILSHFISDRWQRYRWFLLLEHHCWNITWSQTLQVIILCLFNWFLQWISCFHWLITCRLSDSRGGQSGQRLSEAFRSSISFCQSPDEC